MSMKGYTLAVGLLVATCGSGLAQTPATPGPNCLFPLACPGPVPPMPQPLYGPPKEQAAEQPTTQPLKAKHRVRKHVAKKVQ